MIRTAEVLAALSLTTDLASGVPVEKGLRTCVLATAFAGGLDMSLEDRATVFRAALLRSIGCTAFAPENAAYFVDDTAFQAALKRLDPGDPSVFAAQLARFGNWVPARQGELAATFGRIAATVGPLAARTGCEVSRALGGGLGMPPAVLDALDDVYERWDGLGIPTGRRGDELSRPARVVHVAEQAVFVHAETGDAAAVAAEVTRRAGGHLDPALAAAFARDAEALLAALDVPDLLAAVLAAEPGPGARVGAEGLESLCRALAVVADLKGTHLVGHSPHVAAVADRAAAAAGLDDGARAALRAAALLHDLGRTAVPSSVWDRTGSLSAHDQERVRLHSYWTERVLRRCPGLETYAETAAGHHERCDGSGYHRGVPAGDLPRAARLLAAADVFAACREPRPHRPAMADDAARRVLADEVAAGRLDADAVGAVVDGAGLAPLPRAWPCGLTDREVDVLRRAARGLSNRAIATDLGVSERTVGHHLAHVYDKTGRRTRAGAAVFAVEHGLLPA
ncbi:HD domain-containing phosphohydrolase [Actinomycetospora sp. C-140]